MKFYSHSDNLLPATQPCAMLKIATIALFFLAGCWSHAAGAFTCTTNNVTGNWNNAATWNGCGGGVPGAADNVVISNFNRTYTVTANATAASLTFTGGNQNTTLTINNNRLLTINGNVVINAPTANNRMKRIDVAANGRFTANGNLTLTGGGANNRRSELIIGNNAGSNVTIAGDVNVNNTTARVIFSGAGRMNIGGNFANGGTFIGGTGTVVYNGAANQNIGNYTYRNVTINKTGGSANITGATTAITSVLTLTQGNIVTGLNTLITTANCATSVVRTSGHVVGNLQKTIPAGVSSCTFQVGDSTNYTPVITTFVAGTQAGTLAGATFTPDHPNLGTSGLNTALGVNRYWRLTRISGLGLLGSGYNATFNFMAADVDAGVNTAAFEVERYVAPNWFPHTAGTRTATSTQATGITNFGDFAVGERLSGYNTNLGRFNAFETTTPAGSLRGILKTKIAGTAQGVDIIHLNPARTALQAMTGSVVNRTVRVELLNSSDNSGVLDANNCRSTWTTIQTLTPNPVFVNNTSRLTVTFNQPNAWRDVRVRINFPATGAASQIGCSTDRFAIRPNGLVSVNATDNTWASAGITRTMANSGAGGGNVHKAGQPFTLRATGQNAASVTTSNYNGNPTIKTLTCTLPTPTCANGTLTPGAWTAASGIVTTTTAAYSEVGSFNLTLEDQTFAAVDSADSTLLERTIPQAAAITVGRFVPDHFIIATNNTPAFRTFNVADSACSTLPRSFTYVGQPFGYVTPPQALVTAQNAANATTANYRGNLWKISTTVPSDVTQTYTHNPVKTLDTTLTGLPTVTPNNDGTGTVTANTSDVIGFTRNLTTPDTPFVADLSLTMGVVDDSEAGANQGTITTTTPGAVFNGGGSGIAFDSGNAFRYGRLKLANSHGSELLNLPIPMEAQYWNGTTFVTNAEDHCTTIVPGNVLISNPRKNLAVGETGITVSGAFLNGRSTNFRLNKPSGGDGIYNGSVDICVDLGVDTPSAVAPLCVATTPANQPWLQGKWSETNYDDDPVARGTFGIYKNANEIIYMREIY